MCDLQNPIFNDDEKAREHLEAIRWPNGPICPHCGAVDRLAKLNGKGVRPGLYYCNHCAEQFTVTVGTVFERSKIPLSKWVLAFHLMCASKKGISSKQLERMLGVTYKTAWFMSHRIREAMRTPHTGKLGGKGGSGIVEADETYWGNKGKQRPGASGYEHKMKIVSLVERGGKVRSFQVPHVNGATLKPILARQIAKTARLMTDEHGAYVGLEKHFASHETVRHSVKEYTRGDATTNTVEGFFSILKRGLIGTYHHVSEEHLHRYMAEFDFRYNNREKLGVSDSERAKTALKGISGKRLTYRRIGEAQA